MGFSMSHEILGRYFHLVSKFQTGFFSGRWAARPYQNGYNAKLEEWENQLARGGLHRVYQLKDIHEKI